MSDALTALGQGNWARNERSAATNAGAPNDSLTDATGVVRAKKPDATRASGHARLRML